MFFEDRADIYLLAQYFALEAKDGGHIFIQISLQSMPDDNVLFVGEEISNNIRLDRSPLEDHGIEDENLALVGNLDDRKEFKRSA